VSIHPDLPATKEVRIQTGMFLAVSSPKQPSTPTPVATTAFRFTDEGET